MPAVSLESRLSELRRKGEKALVAFVTAGDPGLAELPQVIASLEEGGADVVELGIPFSDPIADGPTIQASSQRALDRGVTTTAVLDALAACSPTVPVVLMGYYNPVLRLGLDWFARSAHEAGASGAIVSDLTPEESDAWIAASKQNSLSTIFLAAPTSTDDRLDAVAARSTGFLYAVSRTGVTGASTTLSPDAVALVNRLRARTETPICVGFGIGKPEHVREVCTVADGAVVGSALVNYLADRWNDGAGRAGFVDLVRSLKGGTR